MAMSIHTEASDRRPNILWVLADDFGLPDIGCYGSAYETPNLDALAEGGLRFEYCFAAPLCAPTRAMCMFGRYGFRTGVTNNGLGSAARPQNEVCIAKVLKQAGYATAVAGKWSDLEYLVTKEDAERWGFDEFMIWGERWEDDGEQTGRARYWAPDYNHNGRILSGDRTTFGPDLLQKFVVDFMRLHRDQPFFVYYPTPLIHYKLQRTPDSTGPMPDLHADNIAYLDKLVGQLISELESLKLREDTLIVFAGDNGSTKGAHTVHGRRIHGKKGELNEGGCRVPLLVNWPGTTPAGKVSKDLISVTDFFPTFSELAGGSLPAKVTIDGHSFAPQLQGHRGAPREWVYVQLGNDRYVRNDRWKLTMSGEFFDMQNAPWQETEVTNDNMAIEARTARQNLQAAFDGLLSQDPEEPSVTNPGTAPTNETIDRKKKARQAK
ncbi:MAG: sulfatase-like hydrolase/transferase [Planctomycetota bacterium]